MKIYEILDVPFKDKLESVLNRIKKDMFRSYEDLKGWPNQSYRESEIDECDRLAALLYMEFSVMEDWSRYLERGVDVWVEYFCSDWWVGDQDTEIHMNRKNTEWEPMWYKPFHVGLRLALLTERWDDIDQVCQWVEWDLPFGYMGNNKSDYDIGLIYFSIAAALRSTPMPGVEQLAERTQKFKRGPKLLYEAWEAVLNKDQEEFDKAFVKTIKQRAKSKTDWNCYAELLAPHHSVVAMTARRMGMSIPELPPELDMYLMLHEKIGLES